MDDYQFIELPIIHKSMTYLLEHLPANVHIFVASRIDLAIPTARLLAKGEFHQIHMQDLRFQLNEGLVFFQKMAELSLTETQVTDLFHSTEGWVSGLQLAAISLKRSPNIAESIQRFSGQHHYIFDYLLEEVFEHQSESMRAFLLETSMLNRMNHSLCEAVTGLSNSQERLEELERLNLFIIPLDEQRNWYRYHHLLSDFLQHLFIRTDTDKGIQVHIRAANWLEQHGLDEEAVEHYLEGKQYADVVRLIERNLLALVQSKSVTLMRWVARLPEDSFVEKPMIELFYISVLLGVGEWQPAFNRVEQAMARFTVLQKQRTSAEWDSVMGNIYFFCAVVAYLQRDLGRTSHYFELVERYMPEGSFFQTMGRNRFQGYDSFDDHLAWINDLHAAEAFLLKWIAAWEEKTEYPFIGYLYVSYSKLLYEWDRLEEAESYANKAIERKDMQPYARIMIPIAISASRIQQARGNSARARDLLTQLKVQIDSPDYELFMLKVEAEQVCLSLQQGSIEAAEAWLQCCGLAHTDEVSLNRVADHLALARVLAESERMEDALYLLGRLYHLLSKEDRLRDRIKVLILQSLTQQRQGQMENALVQLETALHLAEPEGYIRSFIDEGPRMAELLSAYWQVRQGSGLSYKPSVSLVYVKHLLQALSITPEEKQSINESLTEQEKRVLGLIIQGLSNREMADQLNIAGETVKWHIKGIYRKLNVNNRVKALQRAKQLTIGE
ncbi:LuxR C-terminal-related transcriptional regulator [Cohnella endophytica]|uniref:LuxR C-terminal-related transcriptional regulator n=1 Tax=Cohnella endophytica TaxID=2419778 RepID=UPI001314BE89|nr:LuxR C-terminal-related transcriptional regulator [Cohnella endophytica]